MSAVTPRYS